MWYYWWGQAISSKDECSMGSEKRYQANVTDNSIEVSAEHKEESEDKKELS